MQKQSEQQLALKLLGPMQNIESTVNQPHSSGVYPNYHAVNNQMYSEGIYDPKDQRYNKNYDEIGFGIKTWKLNED